MLPSRARGSSPPQSDSSRSTTRRARDVGLHAHGVSRRDYRRPATGAAAPAVSSAPRRDRRAGDLSLRLCPMRGISCATAARRGSHFAARDDMFDRGFFAGFPRRSSRSPARRLLHPLRAGRMLIGSASTRFLIPRPPSLRLGRALEALPAATPVCARSLPPSRGARFRARALEAGLGEPRTVGEALSGTYADLLWTYCSREELVCTGCFEPIWRARAERRGHGRIQTTDRARADVRARSFSSSRRAGRRPTARSARSSRASTCSCAGPIRAQSCRSRSRTTRSRSDATRAYVAFGRRLSSRSRRARRADARRAPPAMPLTCRPGRGRRSRAQRRGGRDIGARGRARRRLALAASRLRRYEGRPCERRPARRRVRAPRLSDALRWARTGGPVGSWPAADCGECSVGSRRRAPAPRPPGVRERPRVRERRLAPVAHARLAQSPSPGLLVGLLHRLRRRSKRRGNAERRKTAPRIVTGMTTIAWTVSTYGVPTSRSERRAPARSTSVR